MNVRALIFNPVAADKRRLTQITKIICGLALLTVGRLYSQDETTPAGMAELARRYEHGIGCPRDIGRALLYYKRAADGGDPGAMVALGDMYREGVCVPQDLPYAMGMYRRSAESGFAPGMKRFGDGLESSGRRDEALGWFRKAAAKGYGPAMTHLGDQLADIEWYRRAVAVNDPPAFARLAESVPSVEAVELLRRGAELGDPVAQGRYGLRIESSDPAQAAKLFRSAAEAGDSAAMARLAAFHETGAAGVVKSPGDALVWYTKAAKDGEPSALFWMAGRLEAEGKKDEARILYKRSASAGNPGAMTRLAMLNGDATLLRAAAAAGDRDAIYAVAVEEKDDAGIRRAAALGHMEALAATGDTAKAADLGHTPSLLKLGRLQEAAEKNDPEGLYLYGLTISDKAEGTRYIQRAADAGHTGAMREMALRLEAGSGVAPDAVASKTWFKEAAAANDPESLFRQGDAESVRKAAEAGYAPAMAQMADQTGEKVWLEKAAASGYVKALTQLGQVDQAAAAGDPEAKTLLADRTKKPRQAYALYLEAAEAGYTPAMRRLGDCHRQGRGTSVSEIDGINWYRKAAMAGDLEAMETLKKLGKTLY